MLKDFLMNLSRRRFGQTLLAAAGGLFGIRLLVRRGMARHAPTAGKNASLHEADFYEVERRLL